MSPLWLILMSAWNIGRGMRRILTVILLVVLSDQGAWVFAGRDREAALILYLFCKPVETLGRACDCQLYWRGLNQLRRNSVQTWPLPDVVPYWTSTFTGVWTRNCLLNTKHIWSSIHSSVLADRPRDTWWALCWPGSFWWASCSFQTSHVEVIKSSHSF